MNTQAQIQAIAKNVFENTTKEPLFAGSVGDINVYSVKENFFPCSFIGGHNPDSKEMEKFFGIAEGEKVVVINTDLSLNTKWTTSLIIAHEIAHHHLGHTLLTKEELDKLKDRYDSPLELEADKFTADLFGTEKVTELLKALARFLNDILAAYGDKEPKIAEGLKMGLKQLAYRQENALF